MAPVPLYDALAADYDRFVNWKGRLAHELPFFDSLFDGKRVGRVLDAACGTGHHAIALAQLGYEVTGTDLSAAMIERARQNAMAQNAAVTFAVTGLGELSALGQTFDAVLCLGNSLPHLLNASTVDHALVDMAGVLRPEGILVIQNRNFDRVWVEQERFMSPQSTQDGNGEWIFVRFYDFHQETVTFNMLRLRRTKTGWAQDAQSTELRPIFAEDLARSLSVAGFEPVTFYGSYDGSTFDPEVSGDLIAVARRRG